MGFRGDGFEQSLTTREVLEKIAKTPFSDYTGCQA